METTKATAIGFFRHSIEMPTPKDMMANYSALSGIFERLQLKPTYFSADDGINRGGFKKFGGSFHRRVMELQTKGFRSVGLAANPTESDAPGYDSFATASFVFGPEAEEVYLGLVVHEPYLVCGSEICDMIVSELAQLWQWDYGFGFERNAATMPGIYLVGGSSNLQSAEDIKRGQMWYDCYQPDERRRGIRDIFPYNMLGPAHLARRLLDGRTLREFIESDPGSELRMLNANLWLWKVSSDRTEAIRSQLRGSRIVITE